MPINRIATSMLHNSTLRDMTRVQTDLSKLSQQISSGKKAATYTELNGIVERVSSYETKVSSIDTFLANNTSISARLNIMDKSLTDIQQVATEFSSLLLQRKTTTNAGAMNFATQAQALLDRVTQSLNTSAEGRFLFSGSDTNTQPVTQPMPAIEAVNVADDNYYNGNDDTLSVRVSDSISVDYGVKANDPAFQKLISSIRNAIAADKGVVGADFNKSTDMLNEAVIGLTTVHAVIGSNMRTIDSVNEQHESFKTYWNVALTADTETDIGEASIKLATDQTVLQATFQAFASLSKLRLTDFLN